MPKLHRSLKKIATTNGLYLGVVLALFTTLVYFINWDLLLQYGFEIIKLPIVLIFAIMAAVSARQRHIGEFAFRDSFSLFFITVFIGLAISLLVKWLFYNHIDPDFGKYVNDMGIAKRKEQLELSGIETKKINEEIAELQSSYLLSFKMLFQEFILRLIGYCIPAVLVALILKTKKPLVR